MHKNRAKALVFSPFWNAITKKRTKTGITGRAFSSKLPIECFLFLSFLLPPQLSGGIITKTIYLSIEKTEKSKN
jgi:hypothetical protein